MSGTSSREAINRLMGGRLEEWLRPYASDGRWKDAASDFPKVRAVDGKPMGTRLKVTRWTLQRWAADLYPPERERVA